MKIVSLFISYVTIRYCCFDVLLLQEAAKLALCDVTVSAVTGYDIIKLECNRF